MEQHVTFLNGENEKEVTIQLVSTFDAMGTKGSEKGKYLDEDKEVIIKVFIDMPKPS
jgi:hypothetical protein